MGTCEGTNYTRYWCRSRSQYVIFRGRLRFAIINDAMLLDSADVLLTVPAAWDAKGCDMMREAAITAGLVRSSHAGDKNWKDRLRIITEPEAAAVHCAHLSDLHCLKPSQNFIVCDAGGGTVDLAAYKVRLLIRLNLTCPTRYICLSRAFSL